MPRLVRMHLNGPVKIEPQEKAIFVCGCGLARTFPICDGTHKACRGTETDPGALYMYDADRKVIVETRRDEPPEIAPTPPPPQ